MKKAVKLGRLGTRHISNVSPTFYIRSKSAVAEETYDYKRAGLYSLVRFATHQLSTLSDDDPKKSEVQADLQRYKDMLSKDGELERQVKQEIGKQLDIIAKLDRYPTVSLEQLKTYADTLHKKWAAANEILSKDFTPAQEFNWEYVNTSKFQLIEINSGVIAMMPDGPVPPGAVELLPWQCIRTKVNGEDVVIEIEDYDEGQMALWFQRGIPVPPESQIIWEYPEDPEAGTTWEIESQRLITSGTPPNALQAVGKFTELVAPEPDPVPQPQKPKFLDTLTPHLEKIAKFGETQSVLNDLLVEPSSMLQLQEEYASHYDREVVEAKRNRYYSALVAAKTLHLPVEFDPIKVKLETTITKCQQVDYLRQQEYYIGEEQLLARLHQRRIDGEIIVPDEELDYMPQVRDESELAQDFVDNCIGRYVWKLFPHVDLDEDVLLRDRRFESMPQEHDPLNKIVEDHEKHLAMHKKLERRLWTSIRTELGPVELAQRGLAIES